MAFTREQIQEFIDALSDDPELRELARAAILSDDFQALPGLVRANTEAISQLDIRITRLTGRLETFIAATGASASDEALRRADQLSVVALIRRPGEDQLLPEPGTVQAAAVES